MQNYKYRYTDEKLNDEFEYKEEYKYPIHALFNITDECNLRCKYCFVEYNPHYMNLETAKKAVDYLYNNLQIRIKNNWDLYQNNISKKASIAFFGGEPTILFNDIIIPTVEYAENTYPNSFSFAITTNGTLLNKEKIDFMKEHHFDVLLSIDGDKKTQDYNRPCKDENISSFDLINKNIKYLLQNFPFMTFRSTAYPDTVEYLYENYCFAEQLGFKYYFTCPDERHGEWPDDKIKILNEQIKKIYLHMINKFLNNEKPLIFSDMKRYLTTILNQDIDSILNQKRPKYHSLSRCGIGITSFSIGYNGIICGCQEQTSKQNNNIFFIGDIYDGIDIEKQKKLLSTYYYSSNTKCIDKTQCDNCMLEDWCKDFICPSLSLDIFNNLDTYTQTRCQFYKMLYINSQALMKILTDNDNQLFKGYLIKNCKQEFLNSKYNNQEE